MSPLIPASRPETGLLDTYITDYRLVGSHLVFRMRNGYSGTMNMRTANLKVFNTSREMKTDLLPGA